MANRCIFLDRDGVINEERGDYTWRVEDFRILPGVTEAIELARSHGFKIVVITNQSGISQGLYSHEDVKLCHGYMNSQLEGLIDGIYYSPYHPNQTNSLSRKPGGLLFEKAISRFDIDPKGSWMVGDRERDLIPARQLGIQTILIGQDQNSDFADHKSDSLGHAVREIILKGSN